MQILIKIALILLPVVSFGQINFFKLYSDNGYDFGQGVIQLEDSSYVLTGTSGSFLGHSQAFLLHVDSTGNRLWSNHYGGAEQDWGRRVLHKKNFGFFVCGYSNSFGSGDHDFYLVKVAENGVEEWEKTYGNSNWERVWDAALTRDTGVVMVGERQGINGLDMFIVRTDSNGDTLWTKSMPNPGDDIASSVEVYNDSILIVGGSRYLADSSQTKGIMYKIHDDGTMLDTAYFTNYPGDFVMNDLHILEDTIQAIGSYKRNDATQWNYVFYQAYFDNTDWITPWVILNDINGDWYGDVFTAYGNLKKRYLSVSFDNNGGSFEGGRDIMILRGTRHLNFEATVGFVAAVEPDVNGEMIPTSDGGALLVGYQQDPLLGEGGGTIFLYKIGPNETYPVISGITSHSNLVGVEESIATINMKVYPNPASDLLHIETPTEELYQFQLIDAHGRQIRIGSFFGENQLSLQGVSPGMYVLNVNNDNGQAIHRIIIQ